MGYDLSETNWSADTLSAATKNPLPLGMGSVNTEYKVNCTNEIPNNSSIAIVSDLYEFNPEPVLSKLAEIQPDVIAVPGDLFENHEFGENLDKEVLAAANVKLLNNSSAQIKNFLFGGIPSKQITGKIDSVFLKRFSNMAGYKVLLCHHPEYYPKLRNYSIHLFLSGHCHGGQIRVCGRGVFAPGQGLFPRYHHGVYEGRLVVSEGCCNTASIPRWGNEPEVVVVRFSKD